MNSQRDEKSEVHLDQFFFQLQQENISGSAFVAIGKIRNALPHSNKRIAKAVENTFTTYTDGSVKENKTLEKK